MSSDTLGDMSPAPMDEREGYVAYVSFVDNFRALANKWGYVVSPQGYVACAWTDPRHSQACGICRACVWICRLSGGTPLALRGRS
jgi:hypothetical protein